MNGDQIISINGNTFEAMKGDFDSILSRTLSNMESKSADEAVITVKVTIKLAKDTNYTSDGNYTDYIRPTFKHEVSSVMQVRDKVSGETTGEKALVYDGKTQQWVLRPMYDGQMSFDQNGDVYDGFGGDAPESGYEAQEGVVDAVDVKMLTKKPEGQEKPARGLRNEIENDENKEDDNPNAKFEFLKQFIGKEMEVTKETHGYSIRLVEDQRVVLTSEVPEDAIIYIPKATAERYVGHKLNCYGYETDGRVDGVVIECADKEEIVCEVDEVGVAESA